MDTVHKRIGSNEIAELLRRDIESGTFRPSERLPPERSLALQYRVARGTVREALTLLAQDGLVGIRAGSGTYVSKTVANGPDAVIENARPLELIDARFALEPHICRLAVIHARKPDIARAEDLLMTMEKSADKPKAFSAADTRFHTLLAETTGNELLIWMLAQINSVRQQEQWSHMRRKTLDRGSMAQYNLQHRQILNAIKSRDAEHAAVLMKQHLETARLSLTRASAV